jgi:carboxyl-terminal processing protease
MRVRALHLGVSLAAALLVSAAAMPAVPSKVAASTVLEPTAAQAQAAMWATRFLTRFHYKRVPLDDAMSASILERYLEGLDAEKLFFTQADIAQFQGYGDKLDDAIYDEELDPIFKVFSVYLNRVRERTDHARGLLAKGFDFTVDESYRYDREKTPWAASSAELDELWRLRVKNDWLRLRLAGKADADIRTTLDKRYRMFQDRVDELTGEDAFQTFLNAYALSIEPHTNYLGPRTAENFNIQMRLSFEGIGAVLGKVDEFTTVRTIFKGGPASRSGQIKVGDHIVAVGQDGEAMQDVIGWRLDDVVDLIRGPKGTKVVLDVVPGDAGPDAKPVHLVLMREEVKLEEQAAKKSIIEVTERGVVRKIGVISLPTFYHDFEGSRRGDADYRSSTRDVAKLLGELKAAGVEGVVVDLRDNGGGSLTEATNLTGLFIDQGPVVQVRDAQGRITVEEDEQAGVAWDGPLAVIVNRSSASASEIFAAALQDYGRALILGSTTYGKGTVQNLLDLDNFAQNDKPKFGQLKLTVAQFFRVNGGSTQNRGVVPDIEFPSAVDMEQWGESTNDNALPWTSITPAEYKGRGDFRELVPLLEAKHESRTAKEPEFQFLLEDVAEYRKLRETKLISLKESERRAERDEQQARLDKRKAELAKLRKEVNTDPDDESNIELDDGLMADERAPDTDEEDAEETPDALMVESAHVLVDAVDLLAADRGLASRVRAFALPSPTSVN